MNTNPLDVIVTLCLSTYLADGDKSKAVKRLARKYRNLNKGDIGLCTMLTTIIDHDNPVAVVRISYFKLTGVEYVAH